jgi:hypothetical protein
MLAAIAISEAGIGAETGVFDAGNPVLLQPVHPTPLG